MTAAHPRKRLPETLADVLPYLERNPRELASIDLEGAPDTVRDIFDERFEFELVGRNQITAKNSIFETELGRHGVFVEKTAVPRVK